MLSWQLAPDGESYETAEKRGTGEAQSDEEGPCLKFFLHIGKPNTPCSVALICLTISTLAVLGLRPNESAT